MISSKNQEKKYILAHDHGTFGSKAAIISINGEVLDFEFKKTPLYLLSDGGAEQKPEEWWDAILETSRRLIDKELVPVEDIVAICCSSQWSGTVAVDKDGNYLTNAIIWMDSRGEPYIKKLFKGIINISGYWASSISNILKWLKITGGMPSPSGRDSIAHILFLKNEYPEIYKKTYKFLECLDYLNLKFSGKFAASYDSIMLHWVTDTNNLNNIHYHEGLIKKLELDKNKLPELKRSIDILGNISNDVADELGLEKDTKIVMGAPDVPSASIGSGAIQDYEKHIYIGTYSWVACHLPYKKGDVFHNIAALPSAIPDRYFIATEQEIAGACLSLLSDDLSFNKDELLKEEDLQGVYKIFDGIVETAQAGDNKLIFTPWLYNERMLIENQTIKDAFHNLSLKNSKAEFVRAVFEGIAFNTRRILKYIDDFIKKKKLNMINMIGEGANSNIWCQIFADVLNRAIKQVKDPNQAKVRGAALIASVALGYIKFSDIPKLIQISNIYHPNLEKKKIYDKLFNKFILIYKNGEKKGEVQSKFMNLH